MSRLQALAKVILPVLLAMALIAATLRFLGYVPSLTHVGGRTLAGDPLDFLTDESADLPDMEISGVAEVDNVILLIGDGMGFSHVQAARSQLVGPNGRLAFEKMPVTGWLTTHSLDLIYTDSAGAATALATGCKTLPGRLAVRADGSSCRTLVEVAREAGMRTGLITDSYFYDATIAAFLVHHLSRNDYQEIIAEMASSDTDILIGGVRREVTLEDREKIVQQFAENGWATARNWQELDQIRQTQSDKSGRVAAIFSESAIADESQPPSLRQLLEMSLERLDQEPGFFLLIETEDPDTGSHNADLGQAIRGIRALADTAEAALDFARENGRTLVLVTSDHETGGLSLVGGRHGQSLRYRWSSSTHTGAPVPLYAFGPGAQRFSGVRDNTEIAPIIADLLGANLQAENNPVAEVEGSADVD